MPPSQSIYSCSIFSNVTDSIVNIDDFKIHENKDGSVDKTKTDLYLHLVDKKDNSIIEVSDVLRMVDQNIEKLDDLFKVRYSLSRWLHFTHSFCSQDFNVLDTQASEALLLTAQFGNPQMVIWLVVVNLFLGALLIVTVTLCLSQRTNYQRELKAARVNAYGNLFQIIYKMLLPVAPFSQNKVIISLLWIFVSNSKKLCC